MHVRLAFIFALGFAPFASGEHGPQQPLRSQPKAGQMEPAVRRAKANPTSEDLSTFAREHLPKVLVGDGQSRLSAPLTRYQHLLLREANLLNDKDRAVLRENLVRTFKFDRPPFGEVPAETIEANLNVRDFPDGMAEMILSALMKLKELGQVVVPHSASYGVEHKLLKGRTGVMTASEEAAIYKDNRWSDLIEYRGYLSFDGKDIELPMDLVVAVDYIKFGFRYDATRKTWVPKYAPQSLESGLIIETDRAIRDIYSRDVNFKDASAVRKEVLENFDSLVSASRFTRDPRRVAGPFIEAFLRQHGK